MKFSLRGWVALGGVATLGFLAFPRSSPDSPAPSSRASLPGAGGDHSCGPNCSHGNVQATRASRSEAELRALAEARKQVRGFRQWWASAHGDGATLTEAQVREARTRALARREAMRLLLREDPDAALEQALGYAEYAALPDELRELVEEPFSTTARLDVEIACGADSQMHHRLVDDQGQAWDLSMPERHRVGLTKRDLPVQGVRLGELATVRAQPFEVVEGVDEAFVTAQWPSGQNNPDVCFHSGKPIEGAGVTAVMGGLVFRFQDEQALQQVESLLVQADARPGMDIGSSWLVVEAYGGDLRQFPAQSFSEQVIAADYSSSTGAKTALFILVDFNDATGQPTDPTTLEQTVDGAVNDGLVRYSYNQASINGTVYATTLRMPQNGSYYVGAATPDDDKHSELHNHAVAAYMAHGGGNPDPLTAYDTVCVVMTEINFTWAGLATLGGQRMWLHNSYTPATILHEVGHNFGLRHANYWFHTYANPNSTNPVDPDGANEEYGDEFDLMGDGNVADGHFHQAGKVFLGWIPGSDWEDLVNAADNGTYRITRFDHEDATGSRGLRIAKSATSDHYWVGFRRDYSQIDDFANGAYLTWERAGGDPSRNQTWLVDTTPLSADGKADAPITLGRTYSDAASNVHITPIAVGGTAPNEWLDVTVNFGPFPGNSNPTGTLIGPSSVNARTTVLFNVEASDGNGDALAYFWNMGDGVVKPNSPSIAHSWIQGGSYDISVTVTDMKGGTATLPLTVTVTDPLNSWSARTSGTSNDLFSIAANDSHVVVGGHRTLLRSTDGVSWSNVAPSAFTNVYVRDICWTGSEFLACGEDYDFELAGGVGAWEGVIFSSTDGSSWTKVYQSNVADTGLWGITHNGNGLAIAVGDDGTIVRRPSAGSWSSIASGIPATCRNQDVAYGGGVFVLVGHNYDAGVSDHYNGNTQVWTSGDGTSWTDYSSGSGLDSWKDFREIHHTGDEFVAGGFYARACYSTDSGQTWTTNMGGDRHDVEAFASGAGIHYAVGINRDNGSADIDLVSSDGRNWTVIDPGNLTFRNGLGFFANTFISVGDAGTIRQSGAISASTTYTDFADTHFPGGGNDALPGSNPDGDWAGNLFEYALGGIPNSSASSPNSPTFSINGSNDPVLEISRSQRRGDVAYSVWWSTDLVDWTRQGLTIETDNATTLRVVADGVDTSGGRGFLKLQLDQ